MEHNFASYDDAYDMIMTPKMRIQNKLADHGSKTFSQCQTGRRRTTAPISYFQSEIELEQSVPPLPSVGTLTPNLWVSLHASHKIKFTFCKLNIKLNLSSHFSNSQVQKPAVSILCTFEQVFTHLGRPSLQKLRNTNGKQVNINCTIFTFSPVHSRVTEPSLHWGCNSNFHISNQTWTVYSSAP